MAIASDLIQKRLVEDVAFRVLAAGNQPDFRTIADFRKLHLTALEELFRQVLRITLETGTMKLGRVALDGSKVKANGAGERRVFKSITSSHEAAWAMIRLRIS